MTHPMEHEPRLLRDVVIAGTVNIDTVIRLERFPRAGETAIASQVRCHLGGKGLSQAIAASRFGRSVALIAATGDDEPGRLARDLLTKEGVDISHLRWSPSETGRAFVWVDSRAENVIAVAQGANAELSALTPADVELVRSAAVVLTQLESGSALAIETIAEAAGAYVVLNAAPAMPIPDATLRAVDLLIVNEIEAEQLAVYQGFADVSQLAEHCGAVLVTLGSRGGRLYRRNVLPLEIPGYEAEAVDTTGAGDTCCGVIAAALSERFELVEAIRLGFGAGSLAVRSEGNADSVPARAAILELVGAGVARSGVGPSR